MVAVSDKVLPKPVTALVPLLDRMNAPLLGGLTRAAGNRLISHELERDGHSIVPLLIPEA